MTQSYSTDVVVIGTGAAGLMAAQQLARAGVATLLLCKESLGGGSTAWAQGGLAAVQDQQRDSLALHASDTVTAGAGLCDPEVVQELVRRAPQVISDLIRVGARFDTDLGGALALGLEGGHHARRIVHAGGDATGAEVSRALAVAVQRLREAQRLRVWEHTMALDAILDAEGNVCGITALQGTELVRVHARAVVVASGGLGQLWTTTSNPPVATGDGLALALRANAIVADVEFLQFHPTVLVPPRDRRDPHDRGVLISEAVRGEGAVLRDQRGELIMAGVHPLADLAPRDVVSAAMQEAMERTGESHLFLDGTALSEQVWREHFPTIVNLCRERGIDPVREPIPVRPAAHYHCGGILADLSGRTSVPGLYAIGEVASTGVHGANRLASNSITEALVAGENVAQLLLHSLPARRFPTLHDLGWADPAPAIQAWTTAPEADRSPSSDRAGGLKAAMDRDAGVLRDPAGLSTTGDRLWEVLQRCRASGAATPPDRASAEAWNQTWAALAVVTAALHRGESRGCHRRRDVVEPQAQWQYRAGWQWDGAHVIATALRSQPPQVQADSHAPHSHEGAA